LRLGTGEGGAAIGAVGGGEISAIGLAAYRAAENLPRKTDLLPKMLMVMRPLALAAAALSTLFAGPPAHARRAHGRSHARAGKSRAVPPLTRDGQPNIQAQAAVITDLQGGGDYFAKNPDAVRPIASISKLMAALVVLDSGLKMDGTQTITAEDRKVATGGARSRLFEGMTLTNKDLLHAMLIASDNRAVPALGRAIGLRPDGLAAAMTRKARALGLLHTAFQDPTGLDDGNVSTPREAIRMLRIALANPTISEILKKARYVAQPTNRRGAIEYVNTDMLVRTGRWQVLGGKTGYTDIARYCLVVAAKIGDREVGMAFLGAEGKLTRFGDFGRAADWLLARPEVKPQLPAHASAGPAQAALPTQAASPAQAAPPTQAAPAGQAATPAPAPAGAGATQQAKP